MSTSRACGATSSSSRSMLTTTSETLGSAKAPVLRRVTTTTFLHSGLLIRSCTMRPPTFPVAPSTIAEYCALASAAAGGIVTRSFLAALGSCTDGRDGNVAARIFAGLPAHGYLLASIPNLLKSDYRDVGL